MDVEDTVKKESMKIFSTSSERFDAVVRQKSKNGCGFKLG